MSRQRVIERVIYQGSNNLITNDFSWRDEDTFRENFIDFQQAGNEVNRYQLTLEGEGIVLDTTVVDGSEKIDVTKGRGIIEADLTDVGVPPGDYNARIMVWRPSDTKGWLIADKDHPLNRLLYRFVA